MFLRQITIKASELQKKKKSFVVLFKTVSSKMYFSQSSLEASIKAENEMRQIFLNPAE